MRAYGRIKKGERIMIRKIIKIDEEKCNGCGACAAACHEGAIEMIDGKAKLTREDYCDGLGDCLPACPADAIGFEEREARHMMRRLFWRLRKRHPLSRFPVAVRECSQRVFRGNVMHAVSQLFRFTASCHSGRYRLSWLR